MPLAVTVTKAGANDGCQSHKVLAALVVRPPAAEVPTDTPDERGRPTARADGAYGNQPSRDRAASQEFRMSAPSRGKKRPGVGKVRNAVERCHNFFAQFGRVRRQYPIGSNGASQAILDARVLARAVLTHGVVPAALEEYESERRPATARIVLANRGNGPEQVMQLVQERAPNGFARIEDVLTAEELEGIASGYKRLAGFDKDALNARASIVTPFPR